MISWDFETETSCVGPETGLVKVYNYQLSHVTVPVCQPRNSAHTDLSMSVRPSGHLVPWNSQFTVDYRCY